MQKLSVSILKLAYPATKFAILESLIEPLTITLDHYKINTVPRVSAFIAQVGHESAGFTARLENLNYSAAGLLKIFPKYFTPSQAAAYARQPERIANRVYALRMGNGSEASGDGWKHRGYGFIQLTGKDNQTAFAKAIGKTLPETIVYLSTVEGACMSAGWFWSVNGLNELADAGNFHSITRRINGGVNGYQDRLKHYTALQKLLS